MGLLRKKNDDPVAVLERELADVTTRRDMLQRKLVEADAALLQARDDRRTVLLESSLDDESAVLKRDENVRNAVDRHAAIIDALEALATKIMDGEQKLASARELVERREIAALARTAADELERAREGFIAASSPLISAMQHVVKGVPGVAHDLLPRTSLLVVSELPAAIAELVASARAHAAQMESGHAPLRRPVSPPPPELPAPPVERARIYCLSGVRWKEREQVICAGKYSYANPPKDIAALAVGRNLAAWPDSDRARETIQAFGLINAATMPDLCIDLDALDQPTPPERTLPPGMIEKIGEPRTMEISVRRS